MSKEYKYKYYFTPFSENIRVLYLSFEVNLIFSPLCYINALSNSFRISPNMKLSHMYTHICTYNSHTAFQQNRIYIKTRQKSMKNDKLSTSNTWVISKIVGNVASVIKSKLTNCKSDVSHWISLSLSLILSRDHLFTNDHKFCEVFWIIITN